jgi:type IV secretory pathway VirB2 component (pilin)
MQTEGQLDDKRTGLKLQFDALLAEYNMLRDQAARFRQMQGQLDSLALTALGLSIPLILVILERSADSIGAVLLLPTLFFAIAFTQLRHERQINLDAIFVDSSLRPKVNSVLSQVSASEVSVFEFESFLSKHFFPPNILVQWVVTTSRGGISIAIGVGVIVVCLYLQLVLFRLKWSAYETWLLLIAILVLVTDLVLGFYIARIHYNFYTKQRSS